LREVFFRPWYQIAGYDLIAGYELVVIEVPGRRRIKVAESDEWRAPGSQTGLQSQLQDRIPEPSTHLGHKSRCLGEASRISMQAHIDRFPEQGADRNPD
jgi:hypothetical protein